MKEENNQKIQPEKVFQLYGEQDIDLNMIILNATDLDKKIIYNDILKDKSLFKNFKLREIEKRLRIYMDEIRGNSLKPHILYSKIVGTEQENVLNAISSFKYNRFYSSPVLFPYTFKSNSIYLKGNYSLFNNRFSQEKSSFKEDEISGAVEYSQKASKYSLSLSNLMFLNLRGNDLELETKFKTSKSERDIKRNQKSSVFKLILSKSFNERPFIYRENFAFDEISKLNLQYSHKIINNEVDEFNCSSELISKLPREDSQHHLKFSYLYNIANINKSNVQYLKFGSSLVNSLNSVYLKSKIFYRKFYFLEPFVYQFNFELGNVTNLKGANENLNIHEKLFVYNFRGIMNPSRKVILEEGKTGDSLGNSNYLMISNKLLLNNIPVFNNFSLVDDGITIKPFLHFNLLWNPEFNGKIKKEENAENQKETNTYNPLHLSAGFGVSLMTQAFAMELYYNAYVKKNSHDVSREFSIKFGLD